MQRLQPNGAYPQQTLNYILEATHVVIVISLLCLFLSNSFLSPLFLFHFYPFCSRYSESANANQFLVYQPFPFDIHHFITSFLSNIILYIHLQHNVSRIFYPNSALCFGNQSPMLIGNQNKLK
eukprot:13505_1